MTITIDLNGRFLGRRMTGVDRFALETIAALDAMLASGDKAVDGMTFRLLVPPGTTVSRSFQHISIKEVGRFSGQLWEQLDLPRFARSSELLVSLCNTAPIFFRRQIVVVHDATTVRIPHTFSPAFRMWYRILVPLLGRTARKILTVSEFSKGELSDAFGIEKRKIDVVVEGGEHILGVQSGEATLEKFDLTKRPFVFAVSSMAAHKNFKLVLDAVAKFDRPPFDVAIAGGANPRVFGHEQTGGQDGVKWLGYVSDEELRALYESALCFVFPSLYEGFGIPPLEAMNCGCPVLAAQAASMPEVCGDAALYFDPTDSVELSGLLMRVFQDEGLRHGMVAKGRERSSQFSWNKAARQLVDACRSSLR